MLLLLLAGCQRPPTPPEQAPSAGQNKSLPFAPVSEPVTPPLDRLNYDKPLTQMLKGESVDRRRVGLKIEKSRYLLTLLYRGKPLKAYPVVFGRNPVDDKRCEGDACTPEGTFHLAEVRPHRLWSKFMLLDYPTAASRQKFRVAKEKGEIPANATIGGAVGIHGVPDQADRAIEARRNWTLGCISLKTADIDELYSVCQKGTRVEIVH